MGSPTWVQGQKPSGHLPLPSQELQQGAGTHRVLANNMLLILSASLSSRERIHLLTSKGSIAAAWVVENFTLLTLIFVEILNLTAKGPAPLLWEDCPVRPLKPSGDARNDWGVMLPWFSPRLTQVLCPGSTAVKGNLH